MKKLLLHNKLRHGVICTDTNFLVGYFQANPRRYPSLCSRLASFQSRYFHSSLCLTLSQGICTCTDTICYTNFLGYEQIFHSVRLSTFSTFTISLMVFYTTIKIIPTGNCNLFFLIGSVLFWKPFHAICFTNIFVERFMCCFIRILICISFYFYSYMKASLRIEMMLMKSIPSRDKYANINNSRKKK